MYGYLGGKDTYKKITQDLEITSARMACATTDKEMVEALKYRQLIQKEKQKVAWTRSFANELGHLAQGVGGQIKGIVTILFLEYKYIPSKIRWDVTYGRVLVDY